MKTGTAGPYGLKAPDIAAIQRVFARHPQVEQVILYGSRAKGNHRPGSDIDLTMKGDRMDLRLLTRIEAELDNLLLPYQIDLSLLAHIRNNDLLDHIARVGALFYQQENLKSVKGNG